MLIDIAILLVPIPTGKDSPVTSIRTVPDHLILHSIQVENATNSEAVRLQYLASWVFVSFLSPGTIQGIIIILSLADLRLRVPAYALRALFELL